MEKKKILIVDDDNDIRETLADVFRAEGFDVFEGTNGKEGVDLALKEHPDFILLDLMMPIMGGHEALLEIRKDEWGHNAKVILLSALSDPTNVTRAIEEGGDEYLIKTNWKLEELVKKVKQYVYGYHH